MRLLIIACARRPATVNAAACQDQRGALTAQQPDWPFRRVAKCASGTHHMIGRIMAKSKSRGAKGKKRAAAGSFRRGFCHRIGDERAPTGSLTLLKSPGRRRTRTAV